MKQILQIKCACGKLVCLVGEQIGNEQVEYVTADIAAECEDCALSNGQYDKAASDHKSKPATPATGAVPKKFLTKFKVLCACGAFMWAVGLEDGDDLAHIPASPGVGLCEGCQSRKGDFGQSSTVLPLDYLKPVNAADVVAFPGHNRRADAEAEGGFQKRKRQGARS